MLWILNEKRSYALRSWNTILERFLTSQVVITQNRFRVPWGKSEITKTENIISGKSVKISIYFQTNRHSVTHPTSTNCAWVQVKCCLLLIGRKFVMSILIGWNKRRWNLTQIRSIRSYFMQILINSYLTGDFMWHKDKKVLLEYFSRVNPTIYR